MSAWKTVMGPYRFVEKPSRKPDNETGIYLYRHEHKWVEGMPNTFPNGDKVPTFRCSICGDVICTSARADS